MEDAEKFKHSISNYLTKNMKLIINKEKTKIYDLTKEPMKYLGYMFYVFKPNTKNKQMQGKYSVANTLPKSKEDEIVDKCRELLKAIKRKTCFETVHDWNAYVIGIHNYYKGMNNFCQCFKKIGWRIYKLFYHTMNEKIKFTQEQSYKNDFMGGTYKSWGKNGYYCFETYPVIEINWTNWDRSLIAGKKGKVTRKNPYNYGKKKHKPGVSLEDIDYLVNSSKYIRNSRLAMFRISKYSSVRGTSYLSGERIKVEDYHCHHIIPLSKGGTNNFNNLCVLSETEHGLLHGIEPERLYELFPKRRKRIQFLIDNL